MRREIFAALLPLGSQSCSHEALLLSIVCCAHKSVTSHKYCILHTGRIFIAFQTSSPFITQEGIISHAGEARNMYLLSCVFFVIVFRPAVCVLFPFHVTCKDTCFLWESVCIFTFIVFNIHCCLGLQQQRDQLLVATQSSMVQRCQPSHRHRLCLKIHIFTYVV